MLVISIDGACRRNGKPNCVSAGGVFIMHYNNALELTHTALKSNYELESTNQRGEMLALLTAIDYVYDSKQSAQVITDSEYIFNTMTKNWCGNWANKGWITSTGAPVKNKDIWLQIKHAHDKCLVEGIELIFYHVKGHTIPFGKVTARRLLAEDSSGMALYNAVKQKYQAIKDEKDVYGKVADLSEKNNGFIPDEVILERFVVTNIVADAVATRCVEAADALV
ncbi:MAG: hypothetical protein GX938_10020 [Spirochaetales bacterium]|nr:hypothetical protein [Spirochaetales bacterium]